MKGPLPPDRGLAGDAGWNMAALAVTAGVGAAATFLIAGRMGAGALGVFAQLYAVHVIGAQVAVLGVHDSAQKHVAERGHLEEPDDGIALGALGVVLLSSVAGAALLAAAAGPLGALVGSRDVEFGLYLVAPGLVAFALNKVLFGVVNGRGRLRTYAMMQFLRAVFVLAAVLVLVKPASPGYAVGGIFTCAELALLPCLLAATRLSPRRARGLPHGIVWWQRHLAFGGRGAINGILLEAHLRVDVMTLSYFVSDRSVGVYAFAMLFAEGLFQVPAVIRTVAYPRLVQLASRGDRPRLARTSRRLSLASGGAAALGAAAIALVYPYVAGRFDPEFVETGMPVLLILLGGITLYAFVVPFDQLLLQSGLPGRQSVLMTAYVAANVALNVALIPRFGLLGAAVATATALVCAAALLLAASWAWLGYRGSVLLHRAPAS
jgi:O-antigen/teichoic acid export membrane protein